MTDLYVILQVQHEAEPEVIRAAHRALARKHHPDFGGDPKRMAAINLAWSILGNPTRRARYDAGPQPAPVAPTPAATWTAPTATPETESNGHEVPDRPTNGMPSRRLSEQRDSGTVVDFGRYSGWTIGRLADQDPNYLRWLARTPIGRRLTAEIDAALGQRTAEASALRPNPVNATRRRGVFASLGTIRTASR